MAYNEHPEVLYAGPVPVPVPADVPNDTSYASQWALPKIDAPTAWTYSKGDGIKIAVIDSGFATGHEDLAAHMTPGWNCDGGGDVAPPGADTHGTRVAGVAAAVTNNGIGIAGVGWNSAILPLSLDTLVEGQSCGQAGDLFLIDKAIAEGARVINMSYTYGGPYPPVCDKLKQAWNSGLLPVGAAGNDGSSTPRDPASCNHTMAVGASSPDDTRAIYSNYGSWMDLSAPGGTGVITGCPPGYSFCCTGLVSNNIYTTNYPAGYFATCGTSFAAPHVSGTAALLMALGLSNCAAQKSILQNFTPVPWDVGWVGRLNAGAALANRQPDDAPSAPTNLSAGNVVGTQITLNWTASTDDCYVTGYEIWRDGALVGTTSGTTFSETAYGSHDYCVRAYDSGGNRSAFTCAGFTPKDDRAVWRPSSGIWYIKYANGVEAGYQWGVSTDKPVPADYDGDGRTDRAVWRPSNGNWLFQYASGGTAGVQWGVSTDKPVPGDYDGDGHWDRAVWRPSNGNWLIQYAAEGEAGVAWGVSTDIPVPADYDGDAQTDRAVWRPSEGIWYIQYAAGGTASFQWGTSGDKPVPADYDGDGRADRAVGRPSEGVLQGIWYIQYAAGGSASFQWGASTDKPVPADYDGDFKTDRAVWRPSDGVWYIQYAVGGIAGFQWGASSDIPVPADYDGL